MADFAALNTALRDALGAWDCPVISVGGSLAGEITTWMRVRYPFLVDMGLAGSAPVLGYPGLADQYTWYHAVSGLADSTTRI
jgi:lysosomal Pro-X carboxypeptidase